MNIFLLDFSQIKKPVKNSTGFYKKLKIINGRYTRIAYQINHIDLLHYTV